jgi:hypothetical protein
MPPHKSVWAIAKMRSGNSDSSMVSFSFLSAISMNHCTCSGVMYTSRALHIKSTSSHHCRNATVTCMQVVIRLNEVLNLLTFRALVDCNG